MMSCCYASRFIPSGCRDLSCFIQYLFLRFSSKASHNIKDCNLEVIQGVARDVKMDSHWFLCQPEYDVIVMAVEADMEGVLCPSQVLLSALPA